MKNAITFSFLFQLLQFWFLNLLSTVQGLPETVFPCSDWQLWIRSVFIWCSSYVITNKRQDFALFVTFTTLVSYNLFTFFHSLFILFCNILKSTIWLSYLKRMKEQFWSFNKYKNSHLLKNKRKITLKIVYCRLHVLDQPDCSKCTFLNNVQQDTM